MLLRAGAGRGGARLPRKQTLNLHQQAFRQNALRDEAVRAVATAFVTERKAMQFGKDDDTQVRVGKADLLSSFQPVDPRHAQIEQDQVRLVERSKLDGVQAITGGTHDFETASKIQIVADGPQGGRRVVRNDNTDFLKRAQCNLRKRTCNLALIMRQTRNGSNWVDCLVNLY
jgi:hypothetical protein